MKDAPLSRRQPIASLPVQRGNQALAVMLRMAHSLLLRAESAEHCMQVIEGLIRLAIANEIGSGPSLKEAMEWEVNAQVGLPPSQGESTSGSQKGQ